MNLLSSSQIIQQELGSNFDDFIQIHERTQHHCINKFCELIKDTYNALEEDDFSKFGNNV